MKKKNIRGIEYIPTYKISQRPPLTKAYYKYSVRDLRTMKVFHMYDDAMVDRAFAEGEISDATHDICLCVSAQFGYSYSQIEKAKAKEAEENQ